MARIPTRFHGPAQVSNAAATKHTAATGEISLLRCIVIENPGATVNFTLSIGTDAAAVRLFDATPIAANVVDIRWVYEPIAAGEIIQAFASVNNQLVLTLSGDRIPAMG